MTQANDLDLVPALEHGCTSWTIVDRGTGDAVFETWSRTVAGKVNQEKYEVLTTYRYLCELNQRIKEENNFKIVVDGCSDIC